jgi:hypothetical protein
MKYNLKFLLLLSSLLVTSISAPIMAADAQEPNQAQSPHSNSPQRKAAENVTNQEWQAFFHSKYSYWDARILANYWGQSLQDAKARMGRKIIWGKKDVAILEQFLVDARIQALQSVGPAPDPSSYKLYRESYTYDDAQALAKFWGDPSPMDAKLRIERNLILGNAEIIKKALVSARANK